MKEDENDTLEEINERLELDSLLCKLDQIKEDSFYLYMKKKIDTK